MNYSKKKRVLSLFTTGILMAGLMAGCTSNTTTSTPSTGSTSSASTSSDAKDLPAPDPNKRYTISYVGYWCGEYQPGNPIEKIISEALNIDIKVRKTANNDQEAINLMFASDELPDCAWLDKDVGFMYDQELVRTFPRAMVEKYAPSYAKMYDNNPIMWAKTLDKDDPTQMRILHGETRQFVDNYLYSDYYRYDWIKALDLDLGVEVEKLNDNLYAAKDGISIDKFEEIMRAFIENDPDGNGKKDTIGVNSANLVLPQYYSGFGFTSGINDVDGKAQLDYTTAGYKEYLKYFQKLYADGLVDPELITPKSNTSWEKADKGIAGYFITSTNALQSWAVGRPPLSLLDKKPDVELLLTPGLKPVGGNVTMHANSSPAYGNFYINAKVKEDDKLAKILEFVEYCMFGETKVSHFFGEENVDWKMENGKFSKINQLPSGEKGTWTFSQHGQSAEISALISNEPLYEAGLKYWNKDANGIWMPFVKVAFKEDVRNETQYQVLKAQYDPNLNPIRDTYRTDCVLGRKDVDATWDAYIAELNKNGYSEMMAEIDSLPLLDELIKQYS